MSDTLRTRGALSKAQQRIMDEDVKEFFAGLSAQSQQPEPTLAKVKSDVSSTPVSTKKKKKIKKKAEKEELEEELEQEDEEMEEEEDDEEDDEEEEEEDEDVIAETDNEEEEDEEGEGQLTVDVYQTSDEIVVQSTIAGVEPDDLEVSINSEMVTIRGKRSKTDKVATSDYLVQELYWGRFSRSIILPQEIDSDNAVAELKNGILTVRLPKIKKAKTKKLKIKSI